jgi:adenylate kinase family enzyme
MKELFLLRGLPGSGKSTLAESIGGMHMEADKYLWTRVNISLIQVKQEMLMLGVKMQ